MKRNKSVLPKKMASPAAAHAGKAGQIRQAEAQFAQAEASRLAGQGAAAVDSYRKALALVPGFFAGHNNLAMTLIGLGRYDEAFDSLQQALVLEPASAAVHINMGLVHKQREQLSAAADSFRRAVALAPDSLPAHYNLGNMLRELGQPQQAIACFRAALAIDAGHADTHNSCGLSYWDLAQFDAAIASYLAALRFNPQCAPAFCNLGNALWRQGKVAIAQDAFREAIAADPAYAMAYLNLAGLQRDLGQFDHAIDSYRKALALQPGWIDAQQGLLFLMSSLGLATGPAYRSEVERFGHMLDQQVNGRAYTQWQPRQAGARLKVGMVSGDLRSHPVAYFLEGVIGHLPALGIDVILYSTASMHDAMSARLQSLSAGWQPLVGLSDAAAAARIHADGIDVLIDLAGHTLHNRLGVFGWRPAPLQASWLGYFATTGVRQIDAILVDAVGVPAGSEEVFVEQPVCLPDTRLCFSAPPDAPSTAPLPAARKGHLTFGCFQHHPKVSDEQLRLWARVLDAVPGAILRWQCRQFADPQCVSETAGRLVRCGIGLERAQLFAHAERFDYLAAHGEVDLILDTNPYPGGTTTCEALWMGVPTVTLAGPTLLSRQGASLLSAAGLADWVAGNDDAYVARAVAAAQDLPGLAALRAGLRQRVAASPLFDGYRFAGHLSAALLALAGSKGR